MAVVVRRRALVNPARRRLTLAQKLAGFGGKRSQAAAMRGRRNTGGLRKITRRAIARGGKGWGAFQRLHPSHSEQLYRKLKSSHERGKRRKNWHYTDIEKGRPLTTRQKRKLYKGFYVDKWGTLRRRGSSREAVKNSAHRKRTRRARRSNVSAIVTAGLPFMNPGRKRKNSMARAHKKTRRRRSTATHHRRRRRTPNPALMRFWRRRHRRRSNPVNAGRRRGRRMNYRSRRNLGRSGGASYTSTLMKGVYVVGGAVGSRWLTQMVLGTGNSGIMGYAGNVVATLALGWAGGRFLGRGSGPWIVAGGAAGLILRVIQDQTPLGKYFNLSGIDSGMGAIIPANFTQPAIFTGQNGMIRVPQGFGPGPAAVPPGGVVRTGMGAPAGRGLYSTGGGRGLYRPA
jgi:hypothetical protein